MKKIQIDEYGTLSVQADGLFATDRYIRVGMSDSMLSAIQAHPNEFALDLDESRRLRKALKKAEKAIYEGLE